MAINQNPSLWAAKKNVRLAKKNRALAYDTYLPTINAVANFSRNLNPNSATTTTISAQSQDLFAYGLQLNWNILDWGVRAAQTSALSAQVENQRSVFKSQQEAILNKVVMQYYNIVNNLNVVTTAIDSVKTSDEAFNLVSIRFLSGQVSALDLTTAQQNLMASKADLALARFNLDLAWLTFQTYLGKMPTI
jgi:outer membrane protein TolC